MNLRLYARVLARFRVLLFVGLILAVVMSLLSYVRVEFEGGIHLEPRKQELWESNATLLLTESGFPQGRDPRVSDPNRFTVLAAIYARLAGGDDIKKMMIREGGPIAGEFFAYADFATQQIPLPAITTNGQGTTAAAARDVVKRGTDAFIRFVTQRQIEAKIPKGQRVQLEVVSSPSAPRLVAPRKKTMPILVFFAVMTGIVALAFALENARPQVRLGPAEPAQDIVPEVRRSA
jgi:hypothetical protein